MKHLRLNKEGGLMKPRRLLDKGHRAVALGLALTGLAAATAAWSGRGPTREGERANCPNHSLAIKVKDGAAVKTITEIPLSGSVTGIIGFHDCQRFIRGQAYDSVYAIFAALHIES